MDKRAIVQRFLDAGLLVHPDVVTYAAESSSSGVIEAIINALPQGISVVTPRDVPGMMQMRTDKLSVGPSPLPEVLFGRENSSVPISEPEMSSRLFRERYDVLSQMMRKRISPVPIEALTRSGSRFQDVEG